MERNSCHFIFLHINVHLIGCVAFTPGLHLLPVMTSMMMWSEVHAFYVQAYGNYHNENETNHRTVQFYQCLGAEACQFDNQADENYYSCVNYLLE